MDGFEPTIRASERRVHANAASWVLRSTKTPSRRWGQRNVYALRRGGPRAGCAYRNSADASSSSTHNTPRFCASCHAKTRGVRVVAGPSSSESRSVFSDAMPSSNSTRSPVAATVQDACCATLTPSLAPGPRQGPAVRLATASNKNAHERRDSGDVRPSVRSGRVVGWAGDKGLGREYSR